MAEEAAENNDPKVDVKTLSDRLIRFALDEKLKTVKDLKQLLASKEEVGVDSIVLVHAGAILDDSKLIEELPAVIQPSTQVKTTTVHWFHMEPLSMALNPIETAKDWDAKNRLRCFIGIYQLSRRNFTEAAALLTECLPTFQDVTFMSFKDLVKYAIIAAILVLERPELNTKIFKSPEVLEVIEQLPELKNLLDAFYLCRYADFFKALAVVEGMLRADWIVTKHASYIVKELRIRSYAQMLQSYRSLTLASMAGYFGVTEDFIDKELSRFIAARRLNCVIDKVAGVVITNPPDRRDTEYHAMVKQGDALLSKIHKLSRVVSQ